MTELKKTTYSFRKMTSAEKNSVKPKKIRIVKASSGTSVASLSNQMDVDGNKTEKFLVLNGMTSNDRVIAGESYKIVVN